MSTHRDRRAVSLDATQQIAMVANMMALELDPANPHHAALLESMERALFRLRKEAASSGNDGRGLKRLRKESIANAQRTGVNPAVQSGDLCNRPVLRRSDLGVDISLSDRLCRIADLTCEIDDLKNGLSDYAKKVFANAVEALHDAVESECLAAEITSIYGKDDMDIKQFLKPEIAEKLPADIRVVTDGKGAVLAEFDTGEQVPLHKMSGFYSTDGVK